MKIILTFALMVLLAGCQSMPDKQTGVAQNLVFLSAQHCLNEYLDDLEKVHYGPCLKVIEVDGESPTPGPDGFIRLPVAALLTINTSCVYRHADGTPIPLSVLDSAEFRDLYRHPADLYRTRRTLVFTRQHPGPGRGRLPADPVPVNLSDV